MAKRGRPTVAQPIPDEGKAIIEARSWNGAQLRAPWAIAIRQIDEGKYIAFAKRELLQEWLGMCWNGKHK